MSAASPVIRSTDFHWPAAWLIVCGCIAGCERATDLTERSVTPLVMGTTCRIVAVGDPDRVAEALQRAVAALRKVETEMSTYDPATPLSRFNQADAGQEPPLDPMTLQVLDQAIAISLQTDGALDVTILPLIRLWDQAAERQAEPSESELQAVRALIGSDKLLRTSDGMRKTTDGVQVTLDAIAKGYAVDWALQTLRDDGMAAGLVEVGGDIACFGSSLKQPGWRIGIQHPRKDGLMRVITSPPTDASWAVCTSGDYRRFLEINGRRYSHIVDPRSGLPVADAASVTVIAADAMTADAWATALSVLGPDEGLPFVEANAQLEAMWITADGPTYSSGFPAP